MLVRIPPLFDPRDRSDEMLETTSAFWSEWCVYSRYRGLYPGAVERSALVLKLLTYAPTGAIVAAPTAGLPEEIGGGRNWDYRYCWIRDATYALYALSIIGFSGDGWRFSEFLSRRCLRSGTTMRIMYGLDGNPLLPERVIDHLAGHRDSRPIRIGNEAAEQRQLDVFGEVLDWAELRSALGASPDADEAAQFAAIADHVCRTWELPDQGLWEVRSGPRHFTFGKAMAWVTLDRGARLLRDRPIWRENRERIMKAIEERGCAGDPPYIAAFFGAETTRAAVLQMALLGLPLDAALLERTVARIEHELRDGDLVRRYRDDDGLAGEEGAFVMTSFWLVEALLATGRASEARELFEKMLARANDVGLYADPGVHDCSRGAASVRSSHGIRRRSSGRSRQSTSSCRATGTTESATTRGDRRDRSTRAARGPRTVGDCSIRPRRSASPSSCPAPTAPLAGDAPRRIFTACSVPRDASTEILEEGDGVVLRASALSDERQGGRPQTNPRRSIRYRTTLLLPGEHVRITNDPVFTDDLLYGLLDAPRRETPAGPAEEACPRCRYGSGTSRRGRRTGEAAPLSRNVVRKTVLRRLAIMRAATAPTTRSPFRRVEVRVTADHRGSKLRHYRSDSSGLVTSC